MYDMKMVTRIAELAKNGKKCNILRILPYYVPNSVRVCNFMSLVETK
jgi:hypothetical protein